jgi:hypothetical protein
MIFLKYLLIDTLWLYRPTKVQYSPEYRARFFQTLLRKEGLLYFRLPKEKYKDDKRGVLIHNSDDICENTLNYM